MSSWDGFEDGDANSKDSTSRSSRSSRFQTAFRTPRPPGVETGVREVLRALSKTLTGSTSVPLNKMVKS